MILFSVYVTINNCKKKSLKGESLAMLTPSFFFEVFAFLNAPYLEHYKLASGEIFDFRLQERYLT